MLGTKINTSANRTNTVVNRKNRPDKELNIPPKCPERYHNKAEIKHRLNPIMPDTLLINI
jgi:hypothetical protein